VQAVGWSPDSTHLATASNDRTARIWDPTTGDTTLTLPQLDGGNYAAIDHDDQLLSCSANAWRSVGWLAPSPFTGRVTRYPAVTFGPLPVPSTADGRSCWDWTH
jgi:WD40 repeat protein